jgi:hypothetical protein
MQIHHYYIAHPTVVIIDPFLTLSTALWAITNCERPVKVICVTVITGSICINNIVRALINNKWVIIVVNKIISN